MEELEINKVYLMDCLEGMKFIKDESVDLCIIDPPYRVASGGKKGSAFRGASGRGKNELSSSGKIFKYNDISPNDYMPEIFRILKQETHFYCMTNDKNLGNMLASAEKAGFKLHNILVWKKGMHTPSQYFLKNVEYILFFRKGRAKYINNMGSYTLIEIDGIFGNKIHPSEKPVALMSHLILNSSNEGDLVFDPFMGSFTTAIACIESRRDFLGFELDMQYYDIGFNRLSKTTIKNNIESSTKSN